MDYSTTSYTFINKEFAHDHIFPLYKLKKPYCLVVINARSIKSDLITHITKLHIVIASYSELIPLFVTKLGHYPIILDLLWLCLHDINIWFTKNMVTFDWEYCLNYCCKNGNTMSIIWILIVIPEK